MAATCEKSESTSGVEDSSRGRENACKAEAPDKVGQRMEEQVRGNALLLPSQCCAEDCLAVLHSSRRQRAVVRCSASSSQTSQMKQDSLQGAFGVGFSLQSVKSAVLAAANPAIGRSRSRTGSGRGNCFTSQMLGMHSRTLATSTSIVALCAAHSITATEYVYVPTKAESRVTF
eukprot:6178148-Pleurochrysis_carterae.AAC.3